MIIIDDQNELKKVFYNNEYFNDFEVRYSVFNEIQSISEIPQLIIIDGSLIEKIKESASTIEKFESVIFLDSNEDNLNLISDIFAGNKNYFYLNLNQNIKLLSSIVKTINYNFDSRSNLRNQLVDFDNKISGIVEVFEEHLIQIKKIYDRSVFFRKENLKNIGIFSKYCAGKTSGGDYFDAISDSNTLYLYCVSANSYLLSNLLMKLFSDLKLFIRKNLDIDYFIKNMFMQIKDTFQNERNLKTEFCILKINLNSLNGEGVMLGDYQLISNTNIEYLDTPDLLQNQKCQKISFNLNRDDRILITSPGIKMLWEELGIEEKIETIFNKKSIPSKDLVDELSFQLRSKSDGYFLKRDSSSILVEVNKNAVIEISENEKN